MDEIKDSMTAPAGKGVPEPVNNAGKSVPPHSGFSMIFDYFEILIISVCVVFLLFTFVIRLCNVSGPSMEATLLDQDKLLITNLFYEPKCGDIVVFHQTITDPNSIYYDKFNETIIKRVIGVPGDHIKIDYDNVAVFVNGEKLEESFLPEDFSYWGYCGVAEYVVPEGMLFVMGDNRNNSTDSRSSIIGFVDERRILGKVICRVLPLSGFGAVD